MQRIQSCLKIGLWSVLLNYTKVESNKSLPDACRNGKGSSYDQSISVHSLLGRPYVGWDQQNEIDFCKGLMSGRSIDSSVREGRELMNYGKGKLDFQQFLWTWIDYQRIFAWYHQNRKDVFVLNRIATSKTLFIACTVSFPSCISYSIIVNFKVIWQKQTMLWTMRSNFTDASDQLWRIA